MHSEVEKLSGDDEQVASLISRDLPGMGREIVLAARAMFEAEHGKDAYANATAPRRAHYRFLASVALRPALERLYRERETLREALEPFAEAAGQVPNGHGPADEPVSDDEPVTMSVVGFLVGDVTAADLARARSALAEQPQ